MSAVTSAVTERVLAAAIVTDWFTVNNPMPEIIDTPVPAVVRDLISWAAPSISNVPPALIITLVVGVIKGLLAETVSPSAIVIVFAGWAKRIPVQNNAVMNRVVLINFALSKIFFIVQSLEFIENKKCIIRGMQRKWNH